MDNFFQLKVNPLFQSYCFLAKILSPEKHVTGIQFASDLSQLERYPSLDTIYPYSLSFLRSHQFSFYLPFHLSSIHFPFPMWLFSDVIMYVEYCQFTFPTISVFIWIHLFLFASIFFIPVDIFEPPKSNSFHLTYQCSLFFRHHSSRWRHPPSPVPATDVLFRSKMAVSQSAKNLEFENWDAQTPVCPSPILAQRELVISLVGATLTTYHI